VLQPSHRCAFQQAVLAMSSHLAENSVLTVVALLNNPNYSKAAVMSGSRCDYLAPAGTAGSCMTDFVWIRDASGYFDNNFALYATAAIADYPLLYLGQVVMHEKKAVKVPALVLFLWNFFWAVFSGACFYHIAPVIIQQTQLHGFKDGVCYDTYIEVSPTANLFRFFFIAAKLFEMGDTVWLVLRKKPVILLHHWHHLTVMLYCWHIAYAKFSGEGGDGSYFATMNSFVHLVMYGYYAATCLGFKNGLIAISITAMQILQMLVGVALLALKTATCNITFWQNVAFGWLIYGSYLLLFIKYFIGRYCKKKHTKKQ